MTHDAHERMVADVGNSAIKLGRVLAMPDTRAPCRLEAVDWMGRVDLGRGRSLDVDKLTALTRSLPPSPLGWYVTSVNDCAELELATWVFEHRLQDHYELLRHDQFPLPLDVRLPERVGTDRLAGAVAANELRSPERGAIIVDVGTAITVDMVSEAGVFCGGAILPGVRAAAVGLAASTKALATVEGMELATAPDPVGRSTTEAIRSGVFWGCVGAVKELISQMSAHLQGPADVFCTGGGGTSLASHVGRDVQVEPHLVLRGTARAGRLLADDRK